jgi:hypothetical protein
MSQVRIDVAQEVRVMACSGTIRFAVLESYLEEYQPRQRIYQIHAA